MEMAMSSLHDEPINTSNAWSLQFHPFILQLFGR